MDEIHFNYSADLPTLGLIVGPPACGKSLAVEKWLIGHEAKVLYVATLPNHPDYAILIQTHRNRRPGTWQTYEACGPLDQDFIRVISEFKPEVVLIEGLLVYLLRRFYLAYLMEHRQAVRAVKNEFLATLEQIKTLVPRIIVITTRMAFYPPLPSHVKNALDVHEAVCRRLRTSADFVYSL